jgi:hypothetical protein
MASGSTEPDHTEAMWRQRGPGTPRRVKTYSAECGYVWEYWFAGQEGAAYRFEASATRRDFSRITVEVNRAALESAAQRPLSDVEEFAAAKMSLLQTFDRCPPSEMPEVVRPGEEDFREILRLLDLL